MIIAAMLPDVPDKESFLSPSPSCSNGNVMRTDYTFEYM